MDPTTEVLQLQLKCCCSSSSGLIDIWLLISWSHYKTCHYTFNRSMLDYDYRSLAYKTWSKPCWSCRNRKNWVLQRFGKISWKILYRIQLFRSNYSSYDGKIIYRPCIHWVLDLSWLVQQNRYRSSFSHCPASSYNPGSLTSRKKHSIIWFWRKKNQS